MELKLGDFNHTRSSKEKIHTLIVPNTYFSSKTLAVHMKVLAAICNRYKVHIIEVKEDFAISPNITPWVDFFSLRDPNWQKIDYIMGKTVHTIILLTTSLNLSKVMFFIAKTKIHILVIFLRPLHMISWEKTVDFKKDSLVYKGTKLRHLIDVSFICSLAKPYVFADISKSKKNHAIDKILKENRKRIAAETLLGIVKFRKIPPPLCRDVMKIIIEMIRIYN